MNHSQLREILGHFLTAGGETAAAAEAYIATAEATEAELENKTGLLQDMADALKKIEADIMLSLRNLLARVGRDGGQRQAPMNIDETEAAVNAAITALLSDLDEVRAGYQTLDKNWETHHDACLNAIRGELSMESESVPEMCARIRDLRAAEVRSVLPDTVKLLVDLQRYAGSHRKDDFIRAATHDLKMAIAEVLTPTAVACTCGIYDGLKPVTPDARIAWRHKAFCPHSLTTN